MKRWAILVEFESSQHKRIQMQLLKTWQWFPCRAARSDLGARISHQWRDFQIYTCSNYNITRLSDTLLFIYFISFYHFFVFSLSVSFLSSLITKAHKDKVASDARSVGQQWLIAFLLFPICRWSVVRMLTNQLVGKETYKGCTAHNHIIPLASQPDLGDVVSKPPPIEDDLLLAEKGLLWDGFLSLWQHCYIFGCKDAFDVKIIYIKKAQTDLLFGYDRPLKDSNSSWDLVCNPYTKGGN